MKSINYIILAIFTSMLWSCNNEDAFFESLNDAPIITISNSTKAVVTDSVKISLKTGQSTYEVILNLNDPNNNVENVTYALISGKGKFYSDKSFQNLQPNPVIPIGGKSTLYFQPEYMGVNTIRFTVLDKFKKSSNVMLNLTAFQNMSPYAEFTYKLLRVNSPYEYELNASPSFDKDEKYGGAIVTYRWTINGVSKDTDKEIFPWVFPSPGNYTVRLEVKDNDGQWGNAASSVITVQ